MHRTYDVRWRRSTVDSSDISIPVLLAPRLLTPASSEPYQLLYHALYRPGSATTVKDLQAYVHRSIESSSRRLVPLAFGEPLDVEIWQVRRQMEGTSQTLTHVLWTAPGTDPVSRPGYNEGCKEGGICSCHCRVFRAPR